MVTDLVPIDGPDEHDQPLHLVLLRNGTERWRIVAPGMDKTDLSLALSAISVLAIFIGVATALVVVAFVAGVIIGRRWSAD